MSAITNKLISTFVIVIGIAVSTCAASTDTISAIDRVIAPPASAEPEVWTFDDCLKWATENNTDVRRAMLNVLQAEQNIYAAKDLWLPSVGFSTSHSYGYSPFAEKGVTKNVYNSSYGISANWTVWEGNVRKYKTSSSKLVKRQQELAGDNVEVNLTLGILQAYLNILYSREAVTIAEQTLEVSRAQTERAKKLLDAGKTSKVDYAQIESQQAQDEYNLVQVRNNCETARMTLKDILQLGLDNKMQIADVAPRDEDVMTPLPDMNTTYSTACGWLPEIQSNELNKEIYANEVKIAKAGYLPTITLNGGVSSGYASGVSGWGTQMKQNFGPNIGLSLSVPIYDANSTKRAVTKARLSELEYDLVKKTLLDNLSQTVENLYIEANNARAKYTAGLTQLNSAQLTGDLTDRQFELGLVNPLELLTAHNNLLNARLELLQSKYMAILANKTIQYYATQQVNL